MSRLLRWLAIAALLALAVFVLFTVVFPWFDQTFVDDPTLEAGGPEVHVVF